MNKKVSIIILTYNRKDLIAQNLPLVIKHTDLNQHEIIVVDNGSTDDSSRFIKESFPQVKLITLKKNIGFGGACNRGVKESTGELIYFLNNDMEVTSGFLQSLLPHFKDPSIFAVSSKVIQPKENMLIETITMAHFAGGTVNPDNRISRYLPEPKTAVEIMYACGGGMLCDKQKFISLGGFDELYYPFYLEDFDLSYQAWKQGFRVLYEPQSTVFHQHSQTIKKYWGQGFIRINDIKNRYVFTWKNITDSSMLLSHFFQVVLIKMIVPNYFEWAGLWKAIRLLPQILKKRRQLRPKAKLSDQKVLAKFAHWVEYVK